MAGKMSPWFVSTRRQYRMSRTLAGSGEFGTALQLWWDSVHRLKCSFAQERLSSDAVLSGSSFPGGMSRESWGGQDHESISDLQPLCYWRNGGGDY